MGDGNDDQLDDGFTIVSLRPPAATPIRRLRRPADRVAGLPDDAPSPEGGRPDEHRPPVPAVDLDLEVDVDAGGLGPWPALAVAALAFFLSVADMSAVNVGFPSIVTDLGASTSAASWVVSGYNVTVGALLLSAGRLADSVGRKRVFVPGTTLFLVGSATAGAAPAVAPLIAARIVQGIGAAAIAATALAVVLPTVPRPRHGLAIGIAGGVGSIGAVAGPLLSSLAIELWSWRGVFLLNLPVGLVVLAVAPRVLTESRDPGASGRIDPIGVALGTVAVAAVLLSIVLTSGDGAGPGPSIALLAVAVVCGTALIRRSRRHPEPMIPVDLLAVSSFRAATVAAGAWSLGFASGFLANSLFLQRQWDLPIVTVGQVLVVSPLVAALVAPVAGRLGDRLGHRWILALGSTACAVGYLVLRYGATPEPRVWTLFAPATAVVGAGVGATVAGWSAAALSDLDPSRFGTADATVRTTQQAGYALGIAVVVALLAPPDVDGLVAHRQAWSFIALMFTCAAVVTVATFPSGARRRRRALAALPAEGPGVTGTTAEGRREPESALVA